VELTGGHSERVRLHCSAACAPGLEALVAAELEVLGVRTGPPAAGRVPFTATSRQLYGACLRSAVASRILVRVASFTARTFADLEREASRVDWSPWTAGGGSFRVAAVKSRLFHTAAVAERLQRAAGGPGDAPFVVRLDHDHVTISADAGGEPLHRRGWRLETAKAPLRPTLAAAALRTVGWDGTAPLVDPLCGSGTIAIEAAGLAAGLAPGRLRSFAFQSWPCFARGTWASVQGEVRLAAASEPAAVVLAADRDAGAAAATTANAQRAGVSLDVRHQPLSALEPPPGPAGWLVTNPPWGGRTAPPPGADLRDLYAALGQVARNRFAGWGVALVVADPRLATATGLPLEHRWATLSGGTRVHLMATSPATTEGHDSAA
jgi:putative N6-adenine-specific DNA methylase